MNHLEALLYSVFFTLMVGFVIPLPGDRSLVQDILSPVQLNMASKRVVNISTEEVLKEGKEKEKEIEVSSKKKSAKEKSKLPINFVDDRQLYVDAIKSVYKVEFPYELADYVVRTAYQEGVDRDLLFALMAAESSFDPTALSHVGAVGYTQVWPKWHQDRINGRDIRDPKVNIQVGANYLRECLDRRGNLYEGLACYNGAKTQGEKDRYFNKVIRRSNLLVSNMDL